jgi:superfamily II DNA/RNA helicase
MRFGFARRFTGLNSNLVASLARHNITAPSNIQSTAIPMLLNNKSMIIASETGSGKTLAYLLPILNTLLESKMDLTENYSPRCLIFTPTKHLQVQIIHVLKYILGYSSFSILPPPAGIPIKIMGSHDIGIIFINLIKVFALRLFSFNTIKNLPRYLTFFTEQGI